MSNPYSISLLNDLHHHFPDLLYRPTRFRNVGDVLNYVVGVAQQNPYEAARREYERRMPSIWSGQSGPTGTHATAVPVAAAVPAAPTTSSQSSSYVSPLQNEMMIGSSYGRRFRSIVEPPLDPIMSFISELVGGSSVGISELSGGSSIGIGSSSSVGIRAPSSVGIGSTYTYYGIPNLQSFLNDRVHIFPSPEQIEAGTILTTALQTQDDNCSICQDPIEQDQSMRMIRHCSHRFHQDCIDTWFEQHVSCPTCRHDIRE
jgi:hypothetical protein